MEDNCKLRKSKKITDMDPVQIAMMQPNDRLREIRTDADLSQAQFASIFHLPQSTYAQYEKGGRSIPDELKEGISNAFNINLHWLITGNGDKYLPRDDIDDETIQNALQKIEDCENGILSGSDSTTLLVPMTNMKLSAGKGWDWDSEESFTGEALPVPRKITCRFEEKNLVAATVKGDSMEPTLHDGEPVVYVRQFENGDGIYALAILDEVYIKRLSIDKLKREVTIISDNPKYPAKTYPMDQEGLQVLGKVVFWIHVE